MADRDFATPTYQLVIEKAYREGELAPSAFHQSHQRGQTLIVGTRADKLLERLGGRAPLVGEQGDGAVTHGR